LTDCITPSSSLFLASTTIAAFARGPLTCGSRQPTANGLSYFSLIRLGIISRWLHAVRTGLLVPYRWRTAGGHVHDALRVRRLHKKNYDYYYNETWKQKHQAQRYRNG